MPCPQCDDTGWKPVDEHDASGRVIRRVVRCSCWRERLTIQRLAEAQIPKRYQHCSLETLRPYNDSLREAVYQAKRFVEAFPVADRGLLLLGHAGVGKTHVAVGVLRAVIEKTGAQGLFYDTRDLLKTIRSTYDPVVKASESSILRPVMECPFLVLDDLGAERPTDWVEEMMNLIVNTRYNERRLTIFTTCRTSRIRTRSCSESGFGCDRGCRKCARRSRSTPPIFATSTCPRTRAITIWCRCGS